MAVGSWGGRTASAESERGVGAAIIDCCFCLSFSEALSPSTDKGGKQDFNDSIAEGNSRLN